MSAVNPSRPTRHALRVVLVCIALSVVAQTAQAQETDPDPSSSAIYRNGPFAWTPALVFSTGHDSNPYREGVGLARPVFETFVVPQVELWWVQPGYTLRMNGAFEALRFADGGGANNNQFGFGIQRRQSIIRPSVNFNRRLTYANPTGFEVGFKSNRIENDVSSDVRAIVSPRSQFMVNGRFTRTRWDADAIYQGSSLREKLNRDTTTVGGGYAYQLTPLTSIGGRVDVSQDRFQFSPERDGTTMRIWSDISFAKPALIFGGVAVGKEKFQSTASNAATFNGLATDASVGYGTPDGTLIKLLLRRRTEYSFDTSLQYFVLSSANVSVSRRLARAWDLAAFLNTYNLDYRPAGLERSAGRVDKVFEFGGVAARRVGQWTRLGVTVERAEKTGAEPYDALRVVAFLAYGSERFQRLDRPSPFER